MMLLVRRGAALHFFATQERKNLGTISCISTVLCLGIAVLQAQETNQPVQIQQLQQQLTQLKEAFEKAEQQHRQQLEALQRQIEALQQSKSRPASVPLQAGPEPATPSNTPPGSVPEKKTWSPADPIRIGGSRAFMDIGLVGTFAAGGSTASDIEAGTQLGGHDPNQRGFTVQSVEANFAGAVDPYFRGNANLAFLLDAEGESSIELEEAWLETVSLPANLQVRAGQYLTEFGRINTQHPHSWAFVDAPLVSGRFLGPDGLRNPGVRASWLMPAPFYSELFLGIQNSQGETAYGFRNDNEGEPMFGRPVAQDSVSSLGDMLYTPRYAASFDLSDTQTMLMGASAAFGPNGSGPDTDTQIFGFDLFWKWKPANHHGGFPFVSWQTEVMLQQYEAGSTSDGSYDSEDGGIDLPSETLTDWGLYSQIAWGFQKNWIAAFRSDFVTRADKADYEKTLGDDPNRLPRWRLSPNLTWYPSEFSKLRLQYNYDDRQEIGVDHSVWLQFEMSLGAHAAHKF
jgi:type II secretory pathway pseudopilin PulG